jgi:hypothetical protein
LKYFSYSDGWLYSEIYFKSHFFLNLNKFEILSGVKMEVYMNLFFTKFWIKITTKIPLSYLFFPIKFRFIVKFTNGVLEEGTGRKLYARLMD